MKIHLPVLGPDLPIHPIPHPHTGLPVYAVGLRRNGAPIWPGIGGAPDDDGGEGGDSDETDDADQDGDSDKDGDEGDDKLGDAGKKALDTMKAQRNKAKSDLRLWTALARELGVKTPAELKALVNKKAGDDKAADDEQAKREADAAATTKANARIVRSEVKAAAGGKLADPNDAVRLLDLTQFEVDDDGEVDEDAIGEAIDDLLKKKPYLAAGGAGKKGLKKDPSQGAQPPAKTSAADRAAARLKRLGITSTT